MIKLKRLRTKAYILETKVFFMKVLWGTEQFEYLCSHFFQRVLIRLETKILIM